MDMKLFNRAQWTIWGMLAIACCAAPTGAQTTTNAYVLGQWEFNGSLSAVHGEPLEYLGDTEEQTEFTTVQIGGESAEVMQFPAADPEQGYELTHGAPPNGGGEMVNQYTLVMDIMYPAGGETWRALFQITPDDDAEMFIAPWGAVGVNVEYHGDGAIRPGVWHRVAFAFDLTNSTVAKYVDGELLATQTLDSAADGRWALGPSFHLFTDDNEETATGYINSLQFRDYTMTAEEIAALGAASAEGISTPGVPTGEEFDLSIARSGSDVVITVNSGGTFQLQKKAALGDASWSNIGDPSSSGQFTIAANESMAFFRARRL